MGGTAGLRRRVLLASAAGLAFFTAFAVNDVGRLEVSHLEAGLAPALFSYRTSTYTALEDTSKPSSKR
jgi:hypothetical protein